MMFTLFIYYARKKGVNFFDVRDLALTIVLSLFGVAAILVNGILIPGSLPWGLFGNIKTAPFCTPE